MKVDHGRAVALLERGGLKTAATWDAGKIVEKLGQLEDVLDGVELNDEDEGLAQEIALALDAGEAVEVEGGAEAVTPPAKKKSKGAKATAGSNGSHGKGKATPVKARPTKSVTDKPPSNKEVVYKLWKKKASADDCLAAVESRIKLQTIKTWFSDWKAGRELPACAKKA